MKRSYTIYHPGALIRDFYDGSAAYYRAPGVTWSPFTKVSELNQRPTEQVGPVTSKKAIKPVHIPIFPAGFSLDGVKGSTPAPTKPEAQQSSKHRRRALIVLATLGSNLLAILGRERHVRLAPKKYAVDRGVYREFPNSTRAFVSAGVGASMLFAVLLVGIWRHTPDTPVPSPSPIARHPANTAPVMMQPAAQFTATQDPTASSPASSSTNPLASTPQSTDPSTDVTTPVTGGMGGGVLPTDPPVTDPVPDPVTPPDDGSGGGGDTGGVVLPPVTIPGVDVQAGDTSLIQTSPISLGL